MIIKPYEAKVLVAILERASNQFDSHGCNDFDLADLLPLMDHQKLLKEMNEANNTPKEYDPDDCSDSWLMSYFASKFEKMINLS
jgi:hypothetical protein